MSWEHLLAFNAVLIASILSPGPAMLLALKSTLSQGRGFGIRTGLGLGLMAACWTLLALLGLEQVFALFPFAYVTLKTLGACYLIWMAVQIWRSAKAPLSAATAQAARPFWTGFAVNLGNPKAVLFASSVLIVIFPADLTIADKILITLNHLALEFVFYTTLALAMSSGTARRGYLGLKPVLDRVAAIILGALGLRLLLDR